MVTPWSAGLRYEQHVCVASTSLPTLPKLTSAHAQDQGCQLSFFWEEETPLFTRLNGEMESSKMYRRIVPLQVRSHLLWAAMPWVVARLTSLCTARGTVNMQVCKTVDLHSASTGWALRPSTLLGTSCKIICADFQTLRVFAV